MKNKILTIIAAIIIMSILLIGCTTSGNNNIKLESGSGTGLGAGIWTYVDPDTHVNYVIFTAGYKGGICPRYNADGTLVITEEIK